MGKPPGPSRSAPLILIIDDVPDNVDLYAEFLRANGLHVIVATNGEDGLAMGKTALPDAIVLDLGLPRIDGWEVARRLRADLQTAHIGIVVLTAHAFNDARESALAAGADIFLTKPCLPHVLLAELQRQLEARRAG